MRESYVLVTKSLLEVIFMDIGEENMTFLKKYEVIHKETKLVTL